MNIDKLKQILIEYKILIDDKPKNFISKCPYCGDHKDPKKQGHLYVSKRDDLPIYHCFYCDAAGPITKLISDLSGNKFKVNEVFSKEELDQVQNSKKTVSSKTRFNVLKFPELDIAQFPNKSLYIRKRTNNLSDIVSIPNLVFDFLQFIHINNLDIVGKDKQLSDFEADMLHRYFVCFVGNHNCTMYCRNSDDTSNFKFKKISLQTDSLNMLDYWSIQKQDPELNTIVLSEGNFNILAEYNTDSLGIKNQVKIYASGNSFSYSSLLKSVCFDNDIYKCNVVVLGDVDKKIWAYKKFLEESEHIISTCKIYMNKCGKDFGTFPIKPVLIN